jgi:hypothetical protein
MHAAFQQNTTLLLLLLLLLLLRGCSPSNAAA